ncbi:MAG TPA: hypothetical protein VIX86_19090 [Streptosporangiaceae bacterium]
MENYNRPPGDGPQDHQPTDQFWPSQGVPPGQQPYGQQPPGLQTHFARDRRKALHWTVGITVAALLAGGGAIAGVALASNPLASAPAASTSTATAGGQTGGGQSGGAAAPGSQAAVLSAALTAADSPDATLSSTPAGVTGAAVGGQSVTGPGTGAGPAAGRCARALRLARAARLSGHPRQAGAAARFAFRCHIRHRIIRFFLLRGVDGQFTFRTRTGALKTLAYERGVIQSVNGSTSIVVKAADGTVWTWDLVSNTVVRESTGKVSESALADGADVWVGGPVINGSKDARLIFVRPPGGAGS